MKTVASELKFRRCLTVYDARIGSIADYMKRLEDENHQDEDATFYCEIGGHTFFGKYNLRTRTGTLSYHVDQEEHES